MSGPHHPSKKLVTFWASEEEKSLLQEAAHLAGFANLADYLRWIGKTQPKPKQMPKEITHTPKPKTSAKPSK